MVRVPLVLTLVLLLGGVRGVGAKLRILSGEGLVRRPANLFDLKDRRLRFSPKGGGYAVSVLPARPATPAPGARRLQQDSEVALPFAFPFGGERHERLFVNMNGNVTFGAAEAALWKERDPWADGGMRSVAAALDARAARGQERMIAALWMNNLAPDNEVLVEVSAQLLTLTWRVRRDDRFFTPLGRSEFQAQLSADGLIEFNYPSVAERDAIVGLFPGGGGPAAVLDSVREPGDAPAAFDIVETEIADLGTVLRFRMIMAEPVPAASAEGTLLYRFFLERGGWPCEISLLVEKGRRGASSCGPSPTVIPFEVEDRSISLYLSKIVLNKEHQFSFSADAFPMGRGGDIVAARDQLRPVKSRRGGAVDLSAGAKRRRGNVYEVFHYPSFPRDVALVLRRAYARFPADDDIAVVFTDFRIDDLFASGGGTGPVNGKIGGLGLREPAPGSHFGSTRLQTSMAPIYLGAPLFREVRELRGRPYRYRPGLGWILHEALHRFCAHLRFRHPTTGRTESLADRDFCQCHWSPLLHAPALHLLGPDRAPSPYAEPSIMGGALWREEADGTFQREEGAHVAGLSALDLYALGLLSPDEVPDTFLLEKEADLGGGRIHARRVPVRARDIIAAMGERVPPSARAQRAFRFGIYLVHEPGRPPEPGFVAQAEQVAAELTELIAKISGGRMRWTISD